MLGRSFVNEETHRRSRGFPRLRRWVSERNDLRRLGQLDAAAAAVPVAQGLFALAQRALLERVEHHVALLAMLGRERVEYLDPGVVGVVTADQEVAAAAVLPPDLHDLDQLLGVLPAVGDSKPDPLLLVRRLVVHRPVGHQVVPARAIDDLPRVRLGGHKGLLSFCAFQGIMHQPSYPNTGATCHKGQELLVSIIS